MIRRSLAIVILILLSSAPAWAHTGAAISGGLTAGLMHPLTGLDHLLAMVGIGVWAAFLGRPMIWVLPAAFLAIMAVGGGLAYLSLPVPVVEFVVSASVVALGVAIVAGWRAPAVIAVTLAAAFGFFHGHAHGIELPHAALPAAYAAGFLLATALLHGSGIAVGLLLSAPNRAVALRTIGALIALAGVSLTAGTLGLA